MSGTALLVMVAAVGVDFGWQPTRNGDLEYIIQIEPQLFELVRDGEPIISEIPKEMRGGRRFRIIVGTAELPREGSPSRPLPSAPAGPVPNVSIPNDAGGNFKDPFPKQPANDQSSGEFTPKNSFPPNVAAPPPLPKNNGGESKSLDPPPLKPSVQFSFDDDKNDGDGKNAKPETDFLTNPNGDLPKNGAPIPIPDPDANKHQPMKMKQPFPAPPTDTSKTDAPGAEPKAFPQASFADDENSPKKPGTDDSTTLKKPELPDQEAAKSSLTTIVITMLLFASLGLNVYLGMLARTFYTRYRQFA